MQDEKGRLMRRNIVRYAVLAYVITLQRISLRVKRRFPTLQHIVDVGQWVTFIVTNKEFADSAVLLWCEVITKNQFSFRFNRLFFFLSLFNLHFFRLAFDIKRIYLFHSKNIIFFNSIKSTRNRSMSFSQHNGADYFCLFRSLCQSLKTVVFFI